MSGKRTKALRAQFLETLPAHGVNRDLFYDKNGTLQGNKFRVFKRAYLRELRRAA